VKLRTSLFLLLVLLISPPPALAQALRSWEKAGHIRTGRFDIFYSSSLAREAERLSGLADQILERQESILGIKAPWMRLPVLLSDRSASLDGYFTAFPSNRISIQLAKAKVSDEFSSYADEVETVFIHELSHAITMNARSPFWAALSWIMGDFLVPPGWIVPKMFSEGTAVWLESMDWTSLTGDIALAGERLPGRLNDPAFLWPAYDDIGRSAFRGPWEVSGLAEYPGSGSLPYLYGALFVDYLAGRFGPEIIGALWRESSKGSLANGFDGTLLSKGGLEKISGKRLPDLWQDFLKSLETVESRAPGENPGTAVQSFVSEPFLSGRIGAYCAAGTDLYYLDLERWGLYRLPIGTGGPAKRLFAADPYLERISLSPGGDQLLLDWVRSDGKGELKPALYAYDLARDKLEFAGPREEAPYAEAADNQSSSKSKPFLYHEQADGIEGYRYGLVRIGTRSLPARTGTDGSMEVLGSRIESVSSLFLTRNGKAPKDGLSIAMEIPRLGSVPGLALLAESKGEWKLWIQDSAFPGGLEQPLPIDSRRLVFKSRDLEGRQSLKILELESEFLNSSGKYTEASWIPLQSYRRNGGETYWQGNNPSQIRETSFPTMGEKLFPLVLETSRYPYADLDSLGILLQGMDITERLAWTASAGWHFGAAMPETAFSLSLNPDTKRLGLSARDYYGEDAGGAGYYRIMGLGLDYEYYLRLLPLQRALRTALSAQLAGLDAKPELRSYFSPDLDYLSLGASLRLGYSDQYSQPSFPFDPKGGQAFLGADYEDVPGLAKAISLSGRLRVSFLRPALQLSLHGAYSLQKPLVFSPAGRFFEYSGDLYPSALAASFPYYAEYAGLDSRSPWYGFGELSLRLFSLKPWRFLGIVKMPWLPSWTLGGLSLRGGLRTAALSIGPSLAFPSSAFVNLEMQLALLAGLAAEGRLVLDLEAAWAFDALLAGGEPLSAGFSLGIRL
jgi:hypothetical protein